MHYDDHLAEGKGKYRICVDITDDESHVFGREAEFHGISESTMIRRIIQHFLYSDITTKEKILGRNRA